MRGTQTVTWNSDDDAAEVEATIEGKFELEDYGVDRSPTFLSLMECDVEWPVSVNSEDVTREEMVSRVGEQETLALEEALCSLIDDDAWDMDEEEPDYD
jgi:hypothetical protein